MRTRLVIPVLFLLAVVAFAADVRIGGDTTIQRDRIGELLIEGADADSAVIWDVSDEEAVDIREVGGRVLWTGRPGVYSVKMRVIRVVDGKPKVDTARAKLVVQGGGPEPKPQPGPKPDPRPEPTPPAPVAGPLYLMLVEETAAATVMRSRWFLDRPLYERVRSKKHVWRVVDKDAVNERGETPRDARAWVDRAKAKGGLPYLAITDAEGNVVFEGKPPATPTDLLALMTKLGG